MNLEFNSQIPTTAILISRYRGYEIYGHQDREATVGVYDDEQLVKQFNSYREAKDWIDKGIDGNW